MSKWAVQAVLYGLYCLLYMCLHISFQGDVDASFPCLFATAFIDEFAVATDGESVIQKRHPKHSLCLLCVFYR